MKKRTTKKPTPPRIDPRVTEALDKLEGGLVYVLAGTVGVPFPGNVQHNIAIMAKAAMDIRSILLLGGDES